MNESDKNRCFKDFQSRNILTKWKLMLERYCGTDEIDKLTETHQIDKNRDFKKIKKSTHRRKSS